MGGRWGQREAMGGCTQRPSQVSAEASDAEAVDEGVEAAVEAEQSHAQHVQHIQGGRGPTGRRGGPTAHPGGQHQVVGGHAHREHQQHPQRHGAGLLPVRARRGDGGAGQRAGDGGVSAQHHQEGNGEESHHGVGVGPLPRVLLEAGGGPGTCRRGLPGGEGGRSAAQAQQPRRAARQRRPTAPRQRQRPPHRAQPIHADERHEGDGAVRRQVIGGPGQAARGLRQQPVAPGQVIGDPEGQREVEEDVGQRQVDEVDAGGFAHFAALQEDQQGSQVARQPHAQHQAVHDGQQHELHRVAGHARGRRRDVHPRVLQRRNAAQGLAWLRRDALPPPLGPPSMWPAGRTESGRHSCTAAVGLSCRWWHPEVLCWLQLGAVRCNADPPPALSCPHRPTSHPEVGTRGSTRWGRFVAPALQGSPSSAPMDSSPFSRSGHGKPLCCNPRSTELQQFHLSPQLPTPQ